MSAVASPLQNLRVRSNRLARAAILLGAVLAAPSAARAQTLRNVSCEGATYRYLLLAPKFSRPKPALLLLHGAGGHAHDLVLPWQSFAETHDLVLIAPELPRDRAFEAIAPAVFRCIIEDARRVVALDPKRLYVLGNSMGGYLAYDAAMFESDYFAAVAVHAAAIDPDFDGILAKATRKIPIAIFIGDRDPLVRLASVRRTRDLLRSAGFPVAYEEIEGHDHQYELAADRINREAWSFFEAHPLP
jgi:poly(3-hydroxybutyrate) depolymerase